MTFWPHHFILCFIAAFIYIKHVKKLAELKAPSSVCVCVYLSIFPTALWAHGRCFIDRQSNKWTKSCRKLIRTLLCGPLTWTGAQNQADGTSLVPLLGPDGLPNLVLFFSAYVCIICQCIWKLAEFSDNFKPCSTDENLLLCVDFPGVDCYVTYLPLQPDCESIGIWLYVRVGLALNLTTPLLIS